MDRVLVIGSANVDLTMGVHRLPTAGETIGDGTFLQAMGGKGANQAVAARRAGADVALLTCLGEDSHGDAMLQAMLAEGIDVAAIRRTAAAPTGVAVVLYDRLGENSIAVAPGANHALGIQDVASVLHAVPASTWLLLQNELAPATLAACLAIARARQLPTLVNAAPADGLDVAALRGESFGLVANEAEAAALLGGEHVTAAGAMNAARHLRTHGFRFAIVTLGALGCAVSTAHGEFHQPAMPVAARDATAAGDTFCGALGAALCGMRQPVEDAIQQAVRFASAAAALATLQPGAQPSIPSRAAIDRALAGWADR